jgi:hypothetical protein
VGKITEFLESLGNSSEEIAKNLSDMGIKGEVGNPQFCPIIKAIYHKMPDMSRGLKVLTIRYSSGYRKFGVYGYLWMNGYDAIKVTWNDCQTIDPHCPSVIGDFVRDFDSGKYPELVGKTRSETKKDILSKLTVEEKMALGL